MFDLDETLFSRSASLRAFVKHQFSDMNLGQFRNLQAVSDRFLELDRRGRVSKRDVYAKLLAEMAVSDATTAGRMWAKPPSCDRRS
jgi:putative hydrolase of the HAD superfamily